jgi:hypothetical protein
MRAVSLLPLTFTVALAAACNPESASRSVPEESASRAAPVAERDLTLQTQSPPAVEVASPVELSREVPREPTPPSTVVSPPEPRPKPAPTPVAPERVEPAPILVPVATSEIRVEPEPEDASSGRELAPGKTVMVLPAASDPSIEADAEDSWLPSERPRSILVGGGGTCRPRRGVRSIGIAGRIPVSIPGRRLR